MPPQPRNPPGIELFRTDKYYIFIRDNYSLWWDRKTGKFDAKTGNFLSSSVDSQTPLQPVTICLNVYLSFLDIL